MLVLSVLGVGRCCRAPDNPHQQIIKRLVAVEGDLFLENSEQGSWKEVPQVIRILLACGTSQQDWQMPAVRLLSKHSLLASFAAV